MKTTRQILDFQIFSIALLHFGRNFLALPDFTKFLKIRWIRHLLNFEELPNFET
jgi:hypothetical protein